ncbi:MAG: hypothetical protein IKX74_07990 [Erysipelotrichaceae bacterium]|nr:hypothetical protein [Erysipelotrichaceae bacterium]MBO4537696.1 hypothetical protein [Erysipelotrichaceae bacterium]MBR5049560.1 hypothetical protein [Erysipelotrichaceae bacterium]
MKLSPPKKVTWIIAVILAVAALVIKLAGLASVAVAFWVAFAAAVLLALATFLTGL